LHDEHQILILSGKSKFHADVLVQESGFLRGRWSDHQDFFQVYKFLGNRFFMSFHTNVFQCFMKWKTFEVTRDLTFPFIWSKHIFFSTKLVTVFWKTTIMSRHLVSPCAFAGRQGRRVEFLSEGRLVIMKECVFN
jgi:hypothetical protein